MSEQRDQPKQSSKSAEMVHQDKSGKQRLQTRNILWQQVSAEVEARLRQSLHHQVLINLGKEGLVQQVKRSWDYEVKLGDGIQETLDPDLRIADVFDRPEIQGRLLILGNPGSGKTTTLLDLARSLLDRAQEDPQKPIPVLVDLSSWANHQKSIPEWLAQEIKLKYGLRADLTQQWLQEHKLLVLLDGLDEVKSDHQKACVEALNQWIRGDAGDTSPSQLVICCRREEYEQIQVPLQLNGVIGLKELSNDQIYSYLESIQRPHLWQLLSQDPTVRDLVRSPLFLSMAVVADQMAPSELQRLQGTGKAQDLLIEIYVRKRIEGANSYTPRQMKFWLVWLAQQMERESQTEFLIETMQPSWLPERLRRQYPLRFGLSFGLIFGLIFGLLFGLLFGLIRGLRLSVVIFGLIFGLLFGLIFGRLFGRLFGLDSIEPFELLKRFPWQKDQNRMIVGLIFGLLFGLISGPSGVIFGLIGGRISWRIFGIYGLSNSEIKQRVYLNQGVWKSFQTGLLTMLSGGLIFGLSGWLFFGLMRKLLGDGVMRKVLKAGLIFGLIDGLIFGLMGGLTVGLMGGLETCLKHLILRQILYQNGYIPWNYARFLNRCTDALVLQRIGGRVRFIHKTVQDHFAQMEFERP